MLQWLSAGWGGEMAVVQSFLKRLQAYAKIRSLSICTQIHSEFRCIHHNWWISLSFFVLVFSSV
jgi:hypothetical protein